MKVSVEPEFWTLFPDAQVNVLHLKGVKNQPENHAYFEELLKNGAKEAQHFLTEETFSQNPVVAQWRQAFSQFKTKKAPVPPSKLS